MKPYEILDQHEMDVLNCVSDGLSCSQIASIYNLTYFNVYDWLKRHNAFSASIHRWTQEDLETLKELYPTISNKKLATLFCTTKQAVEQQAHLLNLHKAPLWTDNDTEMLKYALLNTSREEIYQLFSDRFAAKTVQKHIANLQPTGYKFWTLEEDEIIRTYYAKLGAVGISKSLISRSATAICKRAVYLGVSYESFYYSKEDDEYIQLHWRTMTDEQMADMLHRTESGVRCRRLLLGFKRQDGMAHCYSGLDKFLRSNNSAWRYWSQKHSHGMCVITGKPAEEVHHIYSFHNIMVESLELWGRPLLADTSEYSREDLDALLKIFRSIQGQYPLGEPVTKEIHKEFHRRYGNRNFTPEDWNAFKQTQLKNFM
nr:MAG TPA: DNA-binding protein [Caudoviricetes sp.]